MCGIIICDVSEILVSNVIRIHVCNGSVISMYIRNVIKIGNVIMIICDICIYVMIIMCCGIFMNTC